MEKQKTFGVLHCGHRKYRRVADISGEIPVYIHPDGMQTTDD